MTQRRSTDIAAELAEFRAARAALVRGERVESTSRADRGMRLATMSLADINTAIRELEREYEAATKAEEGTPRREAIGMTF